MKNKIQIKHLWLLALVALIMSGCPDSSRTADSGAIATWTFSVASSDVVGPPPWSTYTVTLDSSANLTWSNVEDGDPPRILTEGSATVSAEDMELFREKAATVDLMNQTSLDPAGVEQGCAGGGAVDYTYTVDGTGSNEFTITTGCDADLAATDANLAAFINAFNSIISRYITQ